MNKLLLSILLFMPSISYADITTGLLDWWTLDDGTGTSGADKGSLNVALTASSSSLWTNGVLNKGMVFNGTSDHMNTASTLNIGSSVMTVAFWANISYASEKLPVETTTNFNSNDNTILIDSNNGGTGKMNLSVHGVLDKYRIENYTPPSAGWHHFVCLFDNSTTAGNTDLYIDGVLQVETSIPNNNKTTSANFGTYTWYFMARAGTSFFQQGSIDDIRIYNRLLTQADVKQLYSYKSSYGLYQMKP